MGSTSRSGMDKVGPCAARKRSSPSGLLKATIFGWGKTVGNFRKTRLVGLAKNKLAGFMVASAYNLVRIAKLLPLPEPA